MPEAPLGESQGQSLVVPKTQFCSHCTLTPQGPPSQPPQHLRGGDGLTKAELSCPACPQATALVFPLHTGLRHCQQP